jgi:type I restriction enzyme M protein
MINLINKIYDINKISLVLDINFNEITNEGEVNYNAEIKLHRDIKNFKGLEEVVRAYLTSNLVNNLDYESRYIELEKEYNIGRPKIKKARIDLILRDKTGNIYFFVEVKAPDKWESDQEYIEGQLFQLAKLETSSIKYLVYYTVVEKDSKIFDKAIIIDYEIYDTFEKWDNAGRPSFGDELTAKYGKPRKEPLVKGSKNDLLTSLSDKELTALRKNLHNVLWGGGGTDDNEIFSSLVNIILAKIHDEGATEEGEEYNFQVFAYGKDGSEIESAERVFDRINLIYRKALTQKLNLSKQETENANIIDKRKFGLNKLLYSVQQLERISFVEGRNIFNGVDILGDFFEGIIREGFKQTKGQFFTPINIVHFIIYALKLDDLAFDMLNNDRKLPYIADPAVGSGTFLIEVMKIITKTIKKERFAELRKNNIVQDRFNELFMPNNHENKWAREYLYGLDINFNLGTATKVNMVLHGDGSTNIFVGERKGDGLLPFRFYTKETEPNYLNKSFEEKLYNNLDVNGNFDVVISNPPFSVDLDKETKRYVVKEFLFGDKKNSENLFVERWYQLLKPKGRIGVVLPESAFDTTENKYVRLFIYKYFKVKAVVSLPQLTFEPFTSTKTSLLFAQKKTKLETEQWNNLWAKYSNEWNNLKTRCENLVAVYLDGKDRKKLPSVKDLTEQEEIEILVRMLKDYIGNDSKKLPPKKIIEKYQDELKELCKYDNETKDVFGFVNTWWVFGEVAKELDYKIFMAEIENVGYKRTKRGEKPMPNELFRVNSEGEILVNDGIKETALDYLREIPWD